MDLKNKVVVVTGGASGIGAALCRRFAQEQAKVVVVDIDAAGAAALAWEIGGLGLSGDVSKEADVVSVVKKAQTFWGPIDLFCSNAGIFIRGDIDVANAQWQKIWEVNTVENEARAVAVAKRYLSYFQGATPTYEAADQTLLRDLIPENRRRSYDVRKVIDILGDKRSFLELRREFGQAMVTGLVRIQGIPIGLMANNCQHMAGTIEPDDADKAARFMQLCNTHGLPIISLIDTPGFMVGPDVERRAQVRHVCRMFNTGSHLQVPFFSIVLRRGYGLGAMAMARGGFHASFFTTAWPTGEFGSMGIEGAVKAGFKKELAAIEDPAARE